MENGNGTTLVSDIPNLPDVTDVAPMPPVKPTKPESDYVEQSLEKPTTKRSFTGEPPVRVDQDVFQAPVLPNSVEGDILQMSGHHFVKMGKVWPMILDALPPGFAPRWIITDDGSVYHQLDDGGIIQEHFTGSSCQFIYKEGFDPSIGDRLHYRGKNYQLCKNGWFELTCPVHPHEIDWTVPDSDCVEPPLPKPRLGEVRKWGDKEYIYTNEGWIEFKPSDYKGGHVQPDNAWPRHSDQQFLTGNIHDWIPPRPGSEESKRQLALHSAIAHGQSRFDLDTAIHLLSEEVERKKIDGISDTELERDAAIIGLSALGRVKKEISQKKRKRVLRGTLLLLVLVAIVTGVVFWALQNVTRGHYTVPTECKVPFGDSEITGNRYRTYSYQELFGYRLTGDDSIVSERTEIKLPGETLTILGFDEAKGKWWRQNYAKGEFGTPMLKPTDKYWFVGEKTKTALVSYDGFCN